MEHLKDVETISVAEAEDEEDEWYARMEAAALSDPEFVSLNPVQSSQKLEADDDTDYFDRMDQYSRVEDGNSAFVDERSTIWQSLLRNLGGTTSSPFFEIKGSDDINLLLCQQWLFSFVPNSLSIYHMINASFLSRHESRRVFIDHCVHPSVVFSYMFKPSTKNLHSTIFSSTPLTKPNSLGLTAEFLKIMKQYPDCQSLYIASTDQQVCETLFISDPRFKMAWVENCKMYVCDSSAQDILNNAISKLPEDYEFCDLCDSDAEIINETWKYRSEDSIHLVRRMVQNTEKCKGVRHVRDGLVAWCLTYDEGPLGMLQTLSSHRKRGLGRCVVAKLLKQILSLSTTETPPYCYIEQSNEASIGLFISLGFYKTIDVVWSEFFLTGNTSNDSTPMIPRS